MSPAFDDNSKFVKFLLPVGKTLETFLQRLFLPLLLPGESLTPREKKKNRRIIHATHSLLASPAILIPLPSPFSSFSFFFKKPTGSFEGQFRTVCTTVRLPRANRYAVYSETAGVNGQVSRAPVSATNLLGCSRKLKSNIARIGGIIWRITRQIARLPIGHRDIRHCGTFEMWHFDRNFCRRRRVGSLCFPERLRYSRHSRSGRLFKATVVALL